MRRPAILSLAALAMAALAASTVADLPLRLIWNATASVPLGLYSVQRAGTLEIGDLVVVMPPAPLARFMVERGYVGADVPLLKHVAGLPSQQVCRSGATVTVDGAVLGEALPRDRLGRDLPDWQGCRTLRDGEVFFMNHDVRDSLDGRYFGPLPAESAVGHARPLWTDAGSDGRREWRAPPS